MQRLWIILFLLLVHFQFCNSNVNQWGILTDAELAKDIYSGYYRWRGPANEDEFSNTTLLFNSYDVNSPCRALAIRDNCFSHNPHRANTLLYRSYKHNSPSLSNPKQIFPLLKNKLVLFVGDTTMASVYASVVCHLSQFSRPTYNFTWHFDQSKTAEDEESQYRCPSHPSCHLMKGDTHFAAHNTTFRLMHLNVYYGRSKSLLQPIMHGKVPAPSMVFINFGAHYNEKERFHEDLSTFKVDITNFQKRHYYTKQSAGPWFWLQNMPQHYPGGSEHKESNMSALTPRAFRDAQTHFNLRCEAIEDLALYHQQDWRNRLVDQVLPDFQRNGRLIEIAEALYDQWDAHVDYGDSFRLETTHADCTHYCTSSGVFRFVVDKVLSAMQTCLRKYCSMDPTLESSAETPGVLPFQSATSGVVGNTIRHSSSNCKGKATIAPRGNSPVGSRPGMTKVGKRDPNC